MNFKCKINETLLRLILIAFNYIFAMLSIALVALGIVYLNDSWWPKEYVAPAFVHLPKLLIILGCLSFLASFAGCYISRTNNMKHLRMFIILLSILLIFELTLAFISFFNISEDSKNITRSVLTIKFVESNETVVNFNVIEENYECCGIDGVDDYNNRNWTYDIPDICLNNVTYGEELNTYDDDGCLNKIWNEIDQISQEIGTYVLFYSFFQISEIACLLFLYNVY